MKKLLIINQASFGYHLDTYYYCKYLKDFYDIVYICWDHGLKRIEMDGVRVLYVNREGNTIFRTMRFLLLVLREIKDKRDTVFIKYFKVVSLALRMFKPHNCMVLDIRTGSVHEERIIRWLQDTRLKIETYFFRHITVISESLAKKLGIELKAHILPLGADVISTSNKNFESLHLLYVGTLFNRNLDITIRGFKLFYDEFKDKIPVSYTIIGKGLYNELQALRNIVSQYGISSVVKITGLIPHNELTPYFDSANIGVSFVPLTTFYDCQPVTKTFEYLLSGMPVIATNTSENRKVINHDNGVLVGDKLDEFYAGIKEAFEKRHLFNSVTIRHQAMRYTSKEIVRKNLKQYLHSINIV
jgi:glycosyltransferase involved in cell wall biosynthesis